MYRAMSKAQNAAKPQHLPQYVGYADVERALGVSRRTVERMVLASGGFRRNADTDSDPLRTAFR